MGIVIEEVEAEVAPTNGPEMDSPQAENRGPANSEIAKMMETQLAKIKRRCERVSAD